MKKLLFVCLFIFGYLLVSAQEVKSVELYDGLAIDVGWRNGVAIVDSLDMTKLIDLVRALKEETVVREDINTECEKCDSLLAQSMTIVSLERDVWNARFDLHSNRGDWYMNLWKEEQRRAKKVGVKWGMWGGLIGFAGGTIFGAFIK